MNFQATNIYKTLGDNSVLNGVSLNVEAGEFIALLGASGSGKTTLLNIIAGLQHADSGELWFDDAPISQLPAGQRRFGMVFQSYALFRHMTVAQNIAFGLQVMPRGERPSKAQIERRVAELLEMISLPDIAKRYPAELSGGQRQRVAMARALAINPRMLLMDEPFSALDAQVRQSLRSAVKELQQQIGVAAILVTHDQSEAWALADKVAVMSQGQITHFDTPEVLQQTWDGALSSAA